MSAAVLFASFNNFDSLIYYVERGQKQSYSAVFPCCDVDSGSHSVAPCTFRMEEQIALYKTH